MMAAMGTPSGASQSGSIEGHCAAGAVKRPLGCAAGRFLSPTWSFANHGSPRQSMSCAGGASVMPSHQTPPSGLPSLPTVRATLVKMVFFFSVAMALGLVFAEVPGATPKKPASGLMARRWPCASGLIHAISSPTVWIFQPSKPFGGIIMAKLVLPQAEGNAAATYVFSVLPVASAGVSTPRMSMCSAIQPSSRAMFDAMRSAKHFLPSSAFPPYPEPNDQISRLSGKCTMYFSLLQGQGTSFCPGASGTPTLCIQGTTRFTSLSISRNTFSPMRVMMRMLTTTYAESVSCTPICDAGESIGPIQNGKTYIVRPRMQPSNRPFSLRRIENGSSQLLVGPAPSFEKELIKVRSSTRATSLASERV